MSVLERPIQPETDQAETFMTMRDLQQNDLEDRAREFVFEHRPQCVGVDSDGEPIACKAALANASFMLLNDTPQELARRMRRIDAACAYRLGATTLCSEVLKPDTADMLYTDVDGSQTKTAVTVRSYAEAGT